MSLILSIVISFFVSLITSFFFLKLGNKKRREGKAIGIAIAETF